MKPIKLFPPLATANVRAKPTTSSAIVGTIEPGDFAYLLSTSPDGWSEIEWYEVYDGTYDSTLKRTGWVFPGVAIRFFEGGGDVDKPADILDELIFPIDPLQPLNADGWPGEWYDATGFARYYTATGKGAYHTGADLNLKNNADKDHLIQSIHDGEVLHAGRYPVWGNIVVVRHGYNNTGVRIRSRYAHMGTLAVKRGDIIGRGDAIGTVGDAFGLYSHHLHFDISPTDVLDKQPTHWPGADKKATLLHYEDPSNWIIKSRP